eukprot:2833966-Rhodomonas_salina.1
MRQPLALHQHPRQPPRALGANLVLPQIKVHQCLALPEHPRQTPRALGADSVQAQVQMSQR